MKRLALSMALLLLLSSLCSCSLVRGRLDDPIENAGEIITAAPRTDTDTEGSGTESETEAPAVVRDFGPLGSADTLPGKTVILTVFASDTDSHWIDSSSDNEMKELTLDILRTSCDWISEQAARYGVTSEFIYDWKEEPDLKLNVNYRRQMMSDDSSLYVEISNSIKKNISSKSLMSYFEADSIIYLFFYNTDFENKTGPSGLTHVYSPDVDVEFGTIPVRTDGQTLSPSVLAHELLHFFGAYDISETGNNPFPAEYIAHLDEIGSDDIMRTVRSENEITATFSDLDAYYTGLIDECADVAEWGLPQAERFISK